MDPFGQKFENFLPCLISLSVVWQGGGIICAAKISGRRGIWAGAYYFGGCYFEGDYVDELQSPPVVGQVFGGLGMYQGENLRHEVLEIY